MQKADEENQKGGRLVISMCLDEMSLRKFISFNGKSLSGFVDMGDGICSDQEATHALVYVAVAVNSSWKLPIGFFFTNSATSEDLANLTRLAITYLNETGAILISVTMDNAASNISMIHKLGGSISDASKLKCSIQEKNILQIPILVILDPSHILKLVRNALHDCSIIYSPDFSPAKWSHISALHNFQKEAGLHFANKLTEKHINFSGQKMKVNLAAQVLSRSVAGGLQYAEENLDDAAFHHTSGTCKYLQTFDILFDRMNSRNPKNRGTKVPVGKGSIEKIRKDFAEAEAYIKSLLHYDPGLQGVKRKKSQGFVVCGSRKKGFLGFLVNMKSFIKIYELYIQTGYLKYLLSYKTSQDHVELFFSNVRGSLGWNNNPTTSEFTSAVKKILLGASFSSIFSNCTLQDDTSVLMLPPKLQDSLDEIKFEFMQEEEVIMWPDSHEHEYVNDIIVYVSGFIQRRILKHEKCESCKNFLLDKQNSTSCNLISVINRGGLCKPSKDLIQVVKTTYSVFKRTSQRTDDYLIQKLVVKVSRNLLAMKPNLFAALLDHNQSATSNHISKMIKQISALAFSIFFNNYCKLRNQEGEKIRKRLSKLILFKNQ